MGSQKDILLIGTGSPAMQLLMTRLRRLGYGVTPVKSPEQAHLTLRVARSEIGAVVLPTDLPVTNLAEMIRFLRSIHPGAELPFVVTGPRPGAEERAGLRRAGVDHALWEPVDPHTLRFQINRALADSRIVLGGRGALRAPADWPVEVVTGGRKKEARIYSISAAGAYLATARPSPRSSSLELKLPLPSGLAKAGARVVMTNVPGNLMRNNLPVGMGVRFVGNPVDLEADLHLYAESRLRSLDL